MRPEVLNVLFASCPSGQFRLAKITNSSTKPNRKPNVKTATKSSAILFWWETKLTELNYLSKVNFLTFKLEELLLEQFSETNDLLLMPFFCYHWFKIFFL